MTSKTSSPTSSPDHAVIFLSRGGVSIIKSVGGVDAATVVLDSARRLDSLRATRWMSPVRLAEPISLQLKRVEREMRKRVENVAELLTRDPTAGRAVVAALFPAGLKAYPTVEADGRKRWRIEGTAVFGPATLADGSVTNGASPGGFEPPLAP